jgi:hypothetical protein
MDMRNARAGAAARGPEPTGGVPLDRLDDSLPDDGRTDDRRVALPAATALVARAA